MALNESFSKIEKSVKLKFLEKTYSIDVHFNGHDTFFIRADRVGDVSRLDTTSSIQFLDDGTVRISTENNEHRKILESMKNDFEKDLKTRVVEIVSPVSDVFNMFVDRVKSQGSVLWSKVSDEFIREEIRTYEVVISPKDFENFSNTKKFKSKNYGLVFFVSKENGLYVIFSPDKKSASTLQNKNGQLLGNFLNKADGVIFDALVEDLSKYSDSSMLQKIKERVL